MDMHLRNSISNLAEAVLQKYKMTIPINLEELISKMNGVLVEVDYYNGKLDRYIYKGSNQDVKANFTIYVQKSQNEKIKRFTIAHEIGHLIINMGYQADWEKWENSPKKYTRSGNSLQEQIANEFAAALLMPEAEYVLATTEYRKGNSIDVQKLADIFEVSLSTARVRGKALEII